MINPSIAVRNKSSVVKDAEIPDALRALQYQVNYHFQPHWGAGCVLTPVPKRGTIPKNAWLLEILDTNPDPKDAGLHLPADPTVHIKVFAKTAQAAGRPWTATASHEILEALVNPWAGWCWLVREQGQDPYIVALEVCDPVDDSRYTCTVGDSSAVVSNFVLPNWFRPGSPKNYDYAGKCNAPLEVLPNGSIRKYGNGKWSRVGRPVPTKGRGEKISKKYEPLSDYLYKLVTSPTQMDAYLKDKSAALAASGLTEEQQKALTGRSHKNFDLEVARGLPDGLGGWEVLMPSELTDDD